ncbi:MAG: hypothetical protein ACTHM9_14845 [Gemmatimonadales bacterium]
MTTPRDASTVSAEPATAETGAGPAGGAREQIRQVKDQVVDQAKTSLRQARDSATSSINDSRSQAADRIGGIADAVRTTGRQLREDHQEGIANLTDSLANQVDRLSAYLRDRDLTDVREDLEQFARRQPAVAVGVALALGMLGARFIKSSRRGGGRRPGRDYSSANWNVETGGAREDFGSGTYGTVGYGSGSYQSGQTGRPGANPEEWGSGYAGA